MSVLNNSKHEQFAQLVAKGVNATKAYVSAGYSANGGRGGAARLYAKATVCARIRELQKTLGAGTIALEITSRNARVTALQKRWVSLQAGLALVLQQRGADMADVPGGASGLLMRDYKGKEVVTRIDPGVGSLLAELRRHERQAAEELEQWKTHVEERKVIDASRAEITLGMVCSLEQLLEMKRKALELQQQEPAA
jgi:Terminase small subunit